MNGNKIAIIGSGAFACAIYISVRDVENNEVSMFFHDIECLEFIKTNAKHPKMDCDFKNTTFLTDDLKNAIDGKETIFLCCIFSVAKKVIEDIAIILDKNTNINLIICCKGMLEEQPFFLCDYAQRKLPEANIMVFSGGSFADEMCKKNNTFVNIACKNTDAMKNIVSIFDSFVKLQLTDKIHEVELLGAIKNIMAIYCGYLSKNNSTNEIIGGLTNFIQNTKLLFQKLGFDDDMLFSPAGIGDIMLTCLSGKSRNQVFGRMIAENIEKAREYKDNTTIEGLDAVFSVKKFCLSKNVDFEMLDDVFNIVNAVNNK